MTFQEIWQQLCRKRPLLADDDSIVEFKSINLKSLLRQAYEQGEKAGSASAAANRDADVNSGGSCSPQRDGQKGDPFDFLSGVFGKRKT